MEDILIDDLLNEIFTRLPSSSSCFQTVPLVSKRWLRLYRASRTSMSLRINPQEDNNLIITLLPSILLNHPCLSSLTFDSKTPISSSVSDDLNDHLISIVSSCCFNLKNFTFLTNPISQSSLLGLSKSLTCLSIKFLRPVSFYWLSLFPSLKALSIDVCSTGSNSNPNPNLDQEVVELGLESISLSGIQSDDTGVTWLWKSCRKVKKLCLKSCGTIGEEIECFGLCLKNVEEVELRTSRSIVDVVLFKVSEICESLKSLLIYDGGNKDGLVHFTNNAKCNDSLKKLDLRLPMDLVDEHIVSLAENFKGLSSVKLESCYFVTGFSLEELALSFSGTLEELSLLSCDAVERESGLLATLGQHLEKLRKLELPFNEWLTDKELVSMLASCDGLVELTLRGCKSLTGSVLVALNKSCVKLRNLDIGNCPLIRGGDVEAFVRTSRCLKKVVVEGNKITENTMKWGLSKVIEVVTVE